MADEIKYKIYGLKEPNSDYIKYIGFTCKELKKRLNNHLYDNTNCKRVAWIKSLKKRNIKPEIVLIEEDISKSEICKKEIHYIKLFKSFGARLVNGTNGGEGLSNITEELRKKISESRKGIPNKSKGIKRKPQSKEQIQNRVNKLIGQKRVITNEWRENMSKGQIKHSLLQLDKNGNFIKEWKSIVEVNKELGFSTGHISKVCLGKRNTHAGFKWKYKYA